MTKKNEKEQTVGTISDDAFEALAQNGREVEAGSWIGFDEIGATVVGRVVEVFEHTFKGGQTRKCARLQSVDGDIRPLSLGGNLPNMVTEALTGHVLAIRFVGTEDVGQAQDMKVYRVVDLGQNFPPRDLGF